MFLQNALYVSGTMVFFHPEIRRKDYPMQKHPWLQKYISKLKDMDAPAIIRLLITKIYASALPVVVRLFPLPTEQHFIKPKPHMLC